MIQLTSDNIKALLFQKGIILIPSQRKISLPIIRRIYKKMVFGIKFDDIKVCDNLVIDGHHRYVSSLLAGMEIGIVKSLRTSATKEYEWELVEFDENDWDTQSKIQHLNEKDADYNQLNVKILNDIICE